MNNTLSARKHVENEQAEIGDVLIAAITGMLQKIKLSQAADLALSGNYSEAEHLLKGSEDEGEPSPAELDLLARIRAQQGRYSDAEDYWNRAVALDPDNSAYQDGLRRIAAERKSNHSFSKLGLVFACMVGIVVIGACWIATIRHIDGIETSLKGDIAAMASRTPKDKTDHVLPIISFGISGISTKKERDAIVLTFDSGLFRRGTLLRNDALHILEDLAKSLEAHVGKVHVTVIGYADSSPMPTESTSYRDNSSLALARSVAVVEILRSKAPLPSGMFSLAGMGDISTPFSNNSIINRLRNRTVLLKITKAEE
jgi:flagellar motor protein MotB